MFVIFVGWDNLEKKKLEKKKLKRCKKIFKAERHQANMRRHDENGRNKGKTSVMVVTSNGEEKK